MTGQPKPWYRRLVKPKVLIPRIVHVIWLGDKPFPYPDNLHSWKMNDGWEVVLWTSDMFPPLKYHWIYDRLIRDGFPVSACADLMRLEILARYGGLCTDADSRCAKPIEQLLDGLTLTGMTGSHGSVQSATLGTVAGHPALQTLADGAGARYLRLAYLKRSTGQEAERPPGSGICDVFGTQYITPVLRQFPDFQQIDVGARRGSRRYICVEGQDVLDDAFIVHTNDMSWKKGGGRDRLVLPTLTPPA